jgi:hypothetical protein
VFFFIGSGPVAVLARDALVPVALIGDGLEGMYSLMNR